ncbi:MAG: uroporphyrinogen-III synthase [Pseudolabrys sp.]|nr:uroporphyrinogen-III synthase [Pseudolabrys sp.]MDP2296368.1 uroporphyrinogen-III synthase [Pseudolabrys sp.]
MRLVLTRPQDDSERSALALRARGHEVLIAPLMRVEMIAADLRPHWGAVIVTSANAAAAIATHKVRDALIKLPVYAVGKRSADAARAVGFTDVTSAGGDLRDLLRIISARRPDSKAPLLYLAGEDRAGDLIGDLAVHGIAAELAVVYRAVTAPFPDDLIAALKAGAVDGVLHFSRRSADNFVDGAKKAGIEALGLAVRHFCLSAQIGEPLIAAGAAKVIVAKRPDEAALMALADAAKT